MNFSEVFHEIYSSLSRYNSMPKIDFCTSSYFNVNGEVGNQNVISETDQLKN